MADPNLTLNIAIVGERDILNAINASEARTQARLDAMAAELRFIGFCVFMLLVAAIAAFAYAIKA